jgi:hypothetical protein
MVGELVTELPDLVEVLVRTVVTLERADLLEDSAAETQAVPQVKRDLLTAGQTNPMQKPKFLQIMMAM